MKVHIGPRDKFPLMSEINMIPLIDVALVLLIIFMVVTPILISSQIKINLPKAVSGIPADATPVKVRINARGTLYLDEQSVSFDELAALLRRRLSAEKSPVVLIEADAAVPFERVVKAMDIAKAQGAQKLGVAVNPETRAEPAAR